MARPVRIVSGWTPGGGGRFRDLLQMGPGPVLAGRGLWWLCRHPQVPALAVLGVTVGVAERDARLAAAAVAAGVFLWMAMLVAWARVRGDAHGLWPTIIGMSRARKVRKRWPRVAHLVGYTASDDEGLAVAELRRVRISQHGVTAVAVTEHVAKHPRDLIKRAPDIAAGMACDRVRVRVESPSTASVTFDWGRHLARTYRLHDLPSSSTSGRSVWPCKVAFGVTEDGGPAELVANLSTLVGGTAGSGKSSAVWAILAGYIREGVPIRVRVLDPGALEFAALKKTLDAKAPSICQEYETRVDNVKEFFAHAKRALDGRRAELTDTDVREHVPTASQPLDILVIDELLPYADAIKGTGVNHPVGEIAYIGRKYGFVVIACSQVAQADTLGRVRDLFPQRICFRTKNRYMTEAVLGDSAESEGAFCSDIDIDDRGVCYMEVPGIRGFIEARAAFVPDGETKSIAGGRSPAPPSEARQVLVESPHVLYRYWGRDDTPLAGQLLYLGITNDLERRDFEHKRDDWEWYQYARPVEVRDEDHYPNKELAETAEELGIRREHPLYNSVFNGGNPDRVLWRKRRPRR